MTISLITDGMLGYFVSLPPISVPEDPEGHCSPLPHRPCVPEGIVEPVSPRVPIGMEASGEGPPHVPCGPTGIDTTIEPPAVPHGTEGSEVAGTEPPAVPHDPRGDPT